ncbi:phenol hydroxylase P0 protein [Oceanisphaera litoralis]|uniref:phenol hydroxylase subunit n=1 Tax=Oceanisphaera litoralis TaxID=225144 RepID=UPI0019571B3F|nr:phenol hydroxylase subunit [Oceanisphaera litoralis]MBM7456770.1 phenol hydroxylase P0 protein [Oceanisphaera litoralis]
MYSLQQPLTESACFIRVTGTQRQRFVEFEFSVGDPELAVDMIMPLQAFEEFCARHGVQHLSAEQVAQVEYDRLKWRFGQPGISE